MAMGKSPDRARGIWRLVAFLGRYGRQPADVVLAMEMRDVNVLAEEIGDMVEEESAIGAGA